MLEDSFLRLKALLLEHEFEKIKELKILIVGVGGVGGAVASALARCAVGSIDLVDGDVFSYSNINRQFGATTKTIGKSKVLVMKEKIEEINPKCSVEPFNFFYSYETKNLIDLTKYNYIVDAIDCVESKLLVVKEAKKKNIKIISSMGAGNKLNPTLVEIADIFQTSYCPLARVFRKKLRESNINSLKVVYSKEKPKEKKFSFVPSCVFVPATFGLYISYEIFKELILLENRTK